MVLAVYPHHLMMDFVMPTWMLVMGQIVSYLSGLPVLVVTALGVLINVSRSGIRWDMTSGLLFLAVVGWSIGVIPAIVDGTIVSTPSCTTHSGFRATSTPICCSDR